VLIDYLAAGLNPGVATLFVQSHVPEHAELHLLLSMITPLGCSSACRRTRTSSRRSRKRTSPRTASSLSGAAERGHLLYRPAFVPVGEIRPRTRNHARDRSPVQPLYGVSSDFEVKAELRETAAQFENYRHLRKKYQKRDLHSLERARRWFRQQPITRTRSSRVGSDPAE